MSCERGAIVGGDLFVQPLEYRSLVRVRVAGPSTEERVFQCVQDVQPGAECLRQCPAVGQCGAGGRAEVGGDKNVVQCDHGASRSVPISAWRS